MANYPRPQQEVDKIHQMFEQFKSYIVPMISYDEYLKNFDFESETDLASLAPVNYLDSFSIRFDSFEDVFSKKRGKKVIIDFILSYGFQQPEAWLKTQLKTFKNKGEADAHIWVFDAESGKRIDVEYLPPVPLPQFIENLKNYLRSDLSFDQDDGGENPPQPQAPPQTPVETPVDQELVHAWIAMNCKFAAKS